MFSARVAYMAISGNNLSVTLLNKTKNAELSAGIVSPSFLMKSSLMPYRPMILTAPRFRSF
jgi:hypothetical protein